MRTCLLCVLVALTKVVSAGDTAITEIADVDEAYYLQGEYAGLILPIDRTSVYRKVGVQVIAQGSQKFEATVLQYGLPGAGWDRTQKAKLVGEKQAGPLELNGDDYSAIVGDGSLQLFSGDGELLGVFPRTVRQSPTLGKSPPADATVLFNGTSVDRFVKGRMTEDGLLMEGTQLKDLYSDFQMHVEFQLPYMPESQGQKRANSGLYLLSRYELQILDSFGLEGKFNECGAMYRYQPPSINMCLPPLQWQTYDIDFRSPRFDADGHKTQNASITVRHNGTTIHDQFVLERKTGAGAKEGPNPLPTKLQNHSDPVRFRNIWIVDRSPNG